MRDFAIDPVEIQDSYTLFNHATFPRTTKPNRFWDRNNKKYRQQLYFSSLYSLHQSMSDENPPLKKREDQMLWNSSVARAYLL